MKNKKMTKITMYIVIGLVCFVLTYVIQMQFKTVEETNITEIEMMRESDLRTEVSNWKIKYEDIFKSMEEMLVKTVEYTKKVNENSESTELVEKELDEARMILGKTNVKGEGIIITIEDTQYKSLDDYDVLQLINDLREMGSEAISVNGHRIVFNTAIAYIGGSEFENGYILVNDQKIRSPYEIKVIGDKEYIQGKLLTGYLESLKNGDLSIKTENKSEIIIEKYVGNDLFFRKAKYE